MYRIFCSEIEFIINLYASQSDLSDISKVYNPTNKHFKSFVKMVYLGRHTKLSENIVPERSPASVNRIRFILS